MSREKGTEKPDLVILDGDNTFAVPGPVYRGGGTLGPDGMNVLEACFCGHDHVNNAWVNYKGVDLCYGYSIDNIAYKDIDKYGLQRGATIITIKPDGKRETKYKNAYLDYGVKSDGVDIETPYYEGGKPDGVLHP